MSSGRWCANRACGMQLVIAAALIVGAAVFFTMRRAGEGNTFRHELADRISSAP